MSTTSPNNELERVRAALRGRRLQAVAAELGVPLPVIEEFTCGRAHLTPELLHGLAGILKRATPAPINNKIPAPRSNTMRLHARHLKCTAVLDPGGLTDPRNGVARVTLEIAIGGKTFTADISAKSVRKARLAITQHGGDGITLMIQGKLNNNMIVEAGLVAQTKTPKESVA